MYTRAHVNENSGLNLCTDRLHVGWKLVVVNKKRKRLAKYLKVYIYLFIIG